jgi:hypothetical protein
MNNEDHFMVKGPLTENLSLQTDEDLIYQSILHFSIFYFNFFYNILKMMHVLQEMFGTDSDQNRMLEEIPRSGADSLPLIKPLRRRRTLCGQAQTQV